MQVSNAFMILRVLVCQWPAVDDVGLVVPASACLFLFTNGHTFESVKRQGWS